MIRLSAAAALLSASLAAQTIATPPPPAPPVVQSQTTGATPEHGTTLSGPAAFSISGVVLSATTGTPLDRAEVTLSTPGQFGSPVAEDVTAENGSFHFDHLQAGRYHLEGSRRGYITSGYQEHDGFYTGVVTGANLAASGLRLELLPTAVIGGTVSDDSGEPIAGAQVRLFREDNRSGEQRIINTQTDTTDDTGTYEFSRVRAGTFYLVVSARPWYAFHPRPKTDDNGNPLPPDEQPHSPLDVAYSTTYYENGSDSDSATPLQVNAGDHVEADFSLHAVPAIHIQIRLQPPSEHRGVPMPQVMQRVFGTDEYEAAQEMAFGTPGGGMIADLSGIAPGRYVLRQYGSAGEGNRSASVDLTANSSAIDFASAGVPGADVNGKIAMANGNKLPEHTRVLLTPADGGPSRENTEVAADGSFALHGVAPGSYDVEVFSSTRISILQMMASGATVQGNRITVAAQPVLLAATLAHGTTAVNGYAKAGGRGMGGVMILLVPHDPAARDLYRRDQSNTDGSFTLNRVIPGDYMLVAIEDGWGLDWAQPAAIAPYLARGIRVRVAGQRSLDLPAAVEVQGR